MQDLTSFCRVLLKRICDAQTESALWACRPNTHKAIFGVLGLDVVCSMPLPSYDFDGFLQTSHISPQQKWESALGFCKDCLHLERRTLPG